MANEERRMLLIREAEIVTIAATEKSRVHLKITASNKKKKTKVIKKSDRGVMPGGALTINMNLDFAPQTKILWELYGCRWPVISRFKALASVEKTIEELFEGSNCTSADIHLFNGSSEVAVLKVSVQLDSPSNVMMAVVPNIEKPSEGSKFLDPSTLQKVFDATKTMIDTLAGVHPAATIAWGFLSIGFEVLKNQRDTKDAICDLYKDMISVYEEFSKDDILKQCDRLQEIYNSLFRQTIECSIFIEGYVKKSGTERLVTMNISDQAAEFNRAFADLKSKLSRGLITESAIVTLGVQELVNIQIMSDRLRNLEPPQELGPKSRCMKGTRVATINEIISWIFQCNGEMMWCKGLAGTGKSSLVGTLHDLLTADMGGRSRLAVFVRYDRIEYSNASKLITSIAYALGMFDVRIGMAISKVVEKSRSVVTMADPSAQFQLLLRGPLERILDLVDEGPLVVIIDGLDECNASSELLITLAEGFGPKLPFMRLIVSSRPVHHIATAFEGRDCIYPLHLDTSSKSVNRDIRFYLEREFARIHDDAFQEKCKELHAVNELTTRASGLFIWAATVASFILAFPGISRLQALLATDIPSDATEALTFLYRTALNTLSSEIPGTNADIKKCVRDVLGAVLAAETPPGMTEEILDNIVLDQGSPPSHRIVSMLGSIISPETEDSPIRLIHKSLDDFLQDRSRCGDDWFVDVTLHRMALAKRCLTSLTPFLLEWSKINTHSLDIIAVPEYISRYALFGALWHINVFDKTGLELFASFFRRHFLPWLDVHLCIGSDSVLQNMAMLLNWSNQFDGIEPRTLFYHAYLFAYRAIEDGGRSRLGPSYVYTRAMCLSPSSNVIRKAWDLEQSNALGEPVFPDRERLLSCMIGGQHLHYYTLPDSNTLMTLSTSSSSVFIQQWEIDTGRQKSSPDVHHIIQTPFFNNSESYTVYTDGRLVLLFEKETLTPPPTSEWIMLPQIPNYASQGTIGTASWRYIGLFDSRTQTFKTYLLSLPNTEAISNEVYDNGIVLTHNAGFFMKITVCQEDNFAWTSIPAYRRLQINRDGSTILLRHHDDTIQLYDARTGAAVFDSLHSDKYLVGVSDDGTKTVLRSTEADNVVSILDMALGGKVLAVLGDIGSKVWFLGESKIAYKVRQCLIVQSLVTGNILFCHGISKSSEELHYSVHATLDGTRVVSHGRGTCMVWDVEDL